MKGLFVLGAVGAMAAVGGGAYAQQLGPGDAAPPFELLGSDGQMHRLADYQGKTVVLAWFLKAFTGG